MRVVQEIPGEHYNTTIYSWNNRLLIKFEAGPLEQTYKVSELDLLPGTDLAAVVADPDFSKKIVKRFTEMDQDFGQLISEYI